MQPFWVYMLRCSDDSYYIGHTDDIERRMGQHVAGEIPGCYTYRRRPIELVYLHSTQTRIEALEAERKIKGWSRAKKQALIAGDWVAINRLGRGKHRHQRMVS
jgi:predicted GIY-YIG superfamily endonuclease